MHQPEPRRLRSQQHPLVVVWMAVCIGICFDRWLHFQPVLYWVLSLSAWLCWWCMLRLRAANSSWLLMLSICLAMAAWHGFSWSIYAEDHIALRTVATEEAELVAVRCRLASIPEATGLAEPEPLATIPQGVKTTFKANVEQVRDGGQWISSTGKISVRVNGHVLGMGVGDLVQIFGTLSLPKRPLNPGQSDNRLSDRSERILCRIDVSYPDCILAIQESSFGANAEIGHLRSAGLGLLDQFVGAPRGVLAGALLLGARDRLEPDRTEVFFHTGTIHLLAISGLHVGILAWGFFFLAKSTNARQWILIALMCLTVLYCALTGMRAPVLRAAILVQVVCVGLLWRRNVVAYNALAAAAIVVLLFRPAELFRPGSQLSFLAVGTLIWLSVNYQPRPDEPLDRLVQRSRPWFWHAAQVIMTCARQLALAGFAIWLVTLPLVMHQFHLLSPISLVLNVVLAAPIALSLLSGFGVLMLGKIFPAVATILGSTCDQSLAFVESSVQWAHALPGAYFWVAGPHSAWCATYYAGLMLLAFVPRLRPGRLWAVAWFMLWLALPMGWELLASSLRADDELRCTFVSVGHGTCVVMEMPDQRVLLYDCGRMGMPQTGVRLVAEFLWHRGISHIDGVVISHADADHYNVLPGLLERFTVGEVFATPFMFDSSAPGVVVLREAIDAEQIPVVPLQANDSMRFGETTIRVLHPLPTGVRGSDNANSIVLEIEHQGKQILLPGDLESPGLEDVIAELPRNCDLLMAPHHGSLRSSPVEFTNWCTPEFVVISGGLDNVHAIKQHDAFAKAGAAVLHTATDGAVTVAIRAGEMTVEAFLSADHE